MIKTREEYEEIKSDINHDISTQHEKSLLEVIESLRNVAREADELCWAIFGEQIHQYIPREHKIRHMLDALPAWMLLEDE